MADAVAAERNAKDGRRVVFQNEDYLEVSTQLDICAMCTAPQSMCLGLCCAAAGC